MPPSSGDPRPGTRPQLQLQMLKGQGLGEGAGGEGGGGEGGGSDGGCLHSEGDGGGGEVGDARGGGDGAFSNSRWRARCSSCTFSSSSIMLMIALTCSLTASSFSATLASDGPLYDSRSDGIWCSTKSLSRSCVSAISLVSELAGRRSTASRAYSVCTQEGWGGTGVGGRRPDAQYRPLHSN